MTMIRRFYYPDIKSHYRHCIIRGRFFDYLLLANSANLLRRRHLVGINKGHVCHLNDFNGANKQSAEALCWTSGFKSK